MRRADVFGEPRMNDTDIERARAAAEDLMDVLSAYENELILLEQETPALGRLREAVGAALAEASFWISDCDSDMRRAPRTTH
jgi:hypothetical protein